jgi:hypothetical protein
MPQANEYKVFDANTLPALETKLNEAARNGFELITAFPNGPGYIGGWPGLWFALTSPHRQILPLS